MITFGAVGGGIGAAVGGGRGVDVGGSCGVQVGVGADSLGVGVDAAANARAGAGALVAGGAGGLGVDVGATVNTGASTAVLVGVDSGVLVAIGARVGAEVAVGSDFLGVAVAGCRAGAAWAGSVGLINADAPRAGQLLARDGVRFAATAKAVVLAGLWRLHDTVEARVEGEE